MKTKIIYISGNEVFDMADIRAAFDEVRAALSLDRSTILFGVPVDRDDAFSDVAATPDMVETPLAGVPEPVVAEVPELSTEPIHGDDIPATVDSEPITQEEEAPVEKPKKTTRRTRAKVIPITPVEPEPEPEQVTDEKPAIPILSVLGAKTEPESEPEPESDVNPVVDIEPVNSTPTVDVVQESDGDAQNPETQHVSITDMLADDDVPVENHEKTLEELLETMTPLGEDEKSISRPVEEVPVNVEPETPSVTHDDTDITLELLATEFAESEDKIVMPTKTETRGKIGKLKNILPFKKAKRDDSGIMGDLFGWAGVANDEDFTIPGFFANASSKK